MNIYEIKKIIMIYFLNSITLGAGEMAEGLRALSALAENLGSRLSIHMAVIVCNSNPKGSNTHKFWPLLTPRTYTQTKIDTLKNK